MPPARAYHIRAVLSGRSLAQALRGLIRDLTWNDAKRLIATRRVSVNGNLCLDEGRRVQTGDVVHVFDNPRPTPPKPDDIRILYLDEHLLVCEKPAGVTTLRHAEERDWPDRRKQKQPTLDELLQQRVDARFSTADTPASRRSRAARSSPPAVEGGVIRRGPRGVRVRPVHRLDRDTSGLMVFALSPVAEQTLIAQFKDHAVRRVYHAVVHGSPRAMTIESYLVRDRGDGLRGSIMAESPPPDAQRAVTHLRPIESFADYSVVECTLETGRTHQIRIHLAEAGHMLCGERTYLRPRPGAEVVVDRSGAPRQALHSATLAMTHPVTGRPLSFTSAWPPDLAAWLRRLKSGGKPRDSGARSR